MNIKKLSLKKIFELKKMKFHRNYFCIRIRNVHKLLNSFYITSISENLDQDEFF